MILKPLLINVAIWLFAGLFVIVLVIILRLPERASLDKFGGYVIAFAFKDFDELLCRLLLPIVDIENH